MFNRLAARRLHISGSFALLLHSNYTPPPVLGSNEGVSGGRRGEEEEERTFPPLPSSSLAEKTQDRASPGPSSPVRPFVRENEPSEAFLKNARFYLEGAPPPSPPHPPTERIYTEPGINRLSGESNLSDGLPLSNAPT